MGDTGDVEDTGDMRSTGDLSDTGSMADTGDIGDARDMGDTRDMQDTETREIGDTRSYYIFSNYFFKLPCHGVPERSCESRIFDNAAGKHTLNKRPSDCL